MKVDYVFRSTNASSFFIKSSIMYLCSTVVFANSCPLIVLGAAWMGHDTKHSNSAKVAQKLNVFRPTKPRKACVCLLQCSILKALRHMVTREEMPK